MNFESELKKGSFIISECNKCKKIVWPPSEFCNHCLGDNSWRKSSGVGKIIEFSKRDEVCFCVVEIEESVRIMCELVSGVPKIGKQIELTDCGVSDGNYFFKIRVIE